MLTQGFFKALLPLFLGIVVLGLCACSQQSFKISNLAKGDIDFVTDTAHRMCEERLRQLASKLYLRNPRELRKGLVNDRDKRIRQLFAASGQPLRFAELNGVSGIHAINLSLDSHYQGDRVFALMAGLIDMMHNAYNYKSDFYLLDELDQDKLHRSARNIEILTWRLANSRDEQGNLLILTNSRKDEVRNLSYMRLFSELIAIQDLMAEVIAQKNHRLINKVTINVASLVFFPL